MWERKLNGCVSGWQRAGLGRLLTISRHSTVFANGYTNYRKLMPFSYNGLQFHGRYEGKCWNYIKDNLSTFRPYLNDKTLFWIVGSEPNSL
jgi:hypothetical protein